MTEAVVDVVCGDFHMGIFGVSGIAVPKNVSTGWQSSPRSALSLVASNPVKDASSNTAFDTHSNAAVHTHLIHGIVHPSKFLYMQYVPSVIIYVCLRPRPRPRVTMNSLIPTADFAWGDFACNPHASLSSPFRYLCNSAAQLIH